MSETISQNPKTAPAAKKPAAKKRAPRARKPDLERLQRLADELAGYQAGGDLTDLLRRLDVEEKAKIDDAPGGGKRVRLAGIAATSTAGVHGALMNWARAARRAVLRGAA